MRLCSTSGRRPRRRKSIWPAAGRGENARMLDGSNRPTHQSMSEVTVLMVRCCLIYSCSTRFRLSQPTSQPGSASDMSMATCFARAVDVLVAKVAFRYVGLAGGSCRHRELLCVGGVGRQVLPCVIKSIARFSNFPLQVLQS